MKLSSLVVLLAFAAAALAHDLYLLPESFRARPGAPLRVAFHNGDAFPESEVAPHLDRLLNAVLKGAHTEAPIQNLRIAGAETLGEVTVPAAGSLYLVVQTRPNFIELEPKKFLSYLQDEGLTEVVEWRASHNATKTPGRERYTKFAKSLITSDVPDDFYKTPLGLRIEIVPLADPSTLEPGQTLPVQVLFEGRPAVDLPVEAAWAGPAGEKKISVAGRTDGAGKIDVPIAREGRWRLHALRMERCKEPAVADWESSWASLTFQVEPARVRK